MTIVEHFLFCAEAEKWPPPVPQTVLPLYLIEDEI